MTSARKRFFVLTIYLASGTRLAIVPTRCPPDRDNAQTKSLPYEKKSFFGISP
jgi:hypothetical protein